MIGIVDYLEEDCPFGDETADFLKLSGNGVMRLISRESGVAACTDEVTLFMRSIGLKGTCLPCGNLFEAGATICKFEGDLRDIFRTWRTVQTLLSVTCAIAAATRRLVIAARKRNPHVMVATTRKTHPGMRKCEQHAVKCGGGEVHRNSLSDSILITGNHLNVISKVSRNPSLRRVEIEPRDGAEARRYAKIADVMLLDHCEPEKLGALVDELRRLNPCIKIAVSGNIDESNVEQYARYADIIVTSSPYYSRPLDLTVKIKRGTL